MTHYLLQHIAVNDQIRLYINLSSVLLAGHFPSMPMLFNDGASMRGQWMAADAVSCKSLFQYHAIIEGM